MANDEAIQKSMVDHILRCRTHYERLNVEKDATSKQIKVNVDILNDDNVLNTNLFCWIAESVPVP